VAEAVPLLREAVGHVGNPRVRNRGTIGGSIAHNDPTAEIPLVMSVLEADYEASNGNSTRSLRAVDFPVTYYTTALADDEVLTGVRLPAPDDDWGWGFHEVSRRAGDFAVVAAAALARCRDSAVESLRVGLAGVGETVVRCRAFEAAATGLAPGELVGVAEAVDADVSPTGDATIGAAYRARLARILAVRAATDACARSSGGAAR